VDKMNSGIHDLMGRRFSHWLALNFAGRSDDNRVLWKCRCDCGIEKIVPIKGLLNGTSRSCGCLRLREIIQRITKHGDASKNSKLKQFYRIWKCLRSRCNSVNIKSYKHYGGRGIVCVPHWDDYENFKQDMLIGYLKTRRFFGPKMMLSIERKDVNGNYCKENCEWIPKSWQSRNTRRNKWFKAVSPNGDEFVSKNQNGFSIEHGLCGTSVGRCLYKYYKHTKGWKFEFVEVKRERKTKRNKLKSI